MTKFNPENKDILTYAESLDPAMQITDAEDAKQYLAAYINYLQKFSAEFEGGKTAEQVAKINLGYYAGYYSDETRERVKNLFNCCHPIFGKVAEKQIAPAKAFQMGVKMSEVRNENRRQS